MATQSAEKLFRVDGLNAVVTGGGSGLGSIIARTLAANGAAKVFIIGRRMEALESVAETSPSNIIPIQGDITSQESLLEAVAQVKKHVQFINVFVANSGSFGQSAIALPQPPGTSVAGLVKTFWDMPMSDFNEVLEVNVTATFYSVLAFLELLEAGNKEGNMGAGNLSQVILNNSVAGLTKMNFIPYGPSKSTSMHIGKMLANMLVPYGIRVNSLAMGLFNVGMGGPYIDMMKMTAKEGEELDLSYIPVGRLGTDEDMAGAILYLVSRAGGFINGSALLSDGGHLAIHPGVL